MRVTKSEMEILELMWKEARPLSRSEIISLCPDKTWKPSSIHILLNDMLEKDVIKVSGFVQSVKNYARTFSPTYTPQEYAAQLIRDIPGYDKSWIPQIVEELEKGGQQ